MLLTAAEKLPGFTALRIASRCSRTDLGRSTLVQLCLFNITHEYANVCHSKSMLLWSLWEWTWQWCPQSHRPTCPEHGEDVLPTLTLEISHHSDHWKRALSVCSSGPTVACWSNHWLWVTLNKLFHFCEPWLSNMKNMTTTNLVRLMAEAALNNYPYSSDLRCHPSQQALFLKQQQQKTVTLYCPGWPWTQPSCLFSEWWDYRNIPPLEWCIILYVCMISCRCMVARSQPQLLLLSCQTFCFYFSILRHGFTL